jgi:sRNA-binding regulator protein Hfq
MVYKHAISTVVPSRAVNLDHASNRAVNLDHASDV